MNRRELLLSLTCLVGTPTFFYDEEHPYIKVDFSVTLDNENWPLKLVGSARYDIIKIYKEITNG
jgi:hypothetical protein